MLRDLAATAPPTGWLIPGLFAHRPAHHTVLQRQLKDLGVPIQQARVATLRQLVLQVPAPVIAEALGFHQTTTTRQSGLLGAEGWSPSISVTWGSAGTWDCRFERDL